LRGFVPIPRQDFHRPVFRDAEEWRVYCFCRKEAAIASRWVSVQTGKGSTKIHLEPGQLVFGRNRWARELGCNPATLARRLKRLERAGLVRIQAGTHFSIVTIVGWPGCGDGDSAGGQAMGRQVGRQVGTQKPAANAQKTRVSDNAGPRKRAGKRAGKWAQEEKVGSPSEPPIRVQTGVQTGTEEEKKTAPLWRRIGKALGKPISQPAIIDEAVRLVQAGRLSEQTVLQLAEQAAKCKHPAGPFATSLEEALPRKPR